MVDFLVVEQFRTALICRGRGEEIVWRDAGLLVDPQGSQGAGMGVAREVVIENEMKMKWAKYA